MSRKISALSAAYILLIMFRNALMGAALLVQPEKFSTPALKTFFSIFGTRPWGILLVASATLILVGVVALRTVVARVGLLLGSIVLFWVGISIVVALVDGIELGSLWGPVIYAWMVISDFLLLGSSFINFVEVRVVKETVLPSSPEEN